MRPSFTLVMVMALVPLLVCSCGNREAGGQQGGPQATASFDLSAARSIIERKNAQFTAAHVAGDVATIDAMFARNAKSFPPGSEVAVGAAALHTLTVE